MMGNLVFHMSFGEEYLCLLGIFQHVQDHLVTTFDGLPFNLMKISCEAGKKRNP